MDGVFVWVEKIMLDKKNDSKALEIDNKKKKVGIFVIVGVIVTLIDFIIYNIVIFLLKNSSESLFMAACVAGVVAAIMAYILHKNFTWRGRKTDKYTSLRFFAWNILLVLTVRPILVWIFGRLGGLYEFCFMIAKWLSLPFSLAFIKSTGVYGLMTVVTMTLNFIGYEKIVFRQQINVQGVRQSGKKE